MIKTHIFIFILLPVFYICSTANAQCVFNKTLLKFDGSAKKQALCLMRPVRRGGKLGPQPSKLPEPFATLIGSKFNLKTANIQKLADLKGLSANQIGGEMTNPLSKAKDGSKNAPYARYFVIHDTSTPNYKLKKFPADINASSWKHNKLEVWDSGTKSKAHVFINRLGDSISPVVFSKPWRATKFELRYGNTDPKGLFIHCELVQPRRSNKDGPVDNDAVSPSPGFSEAQYSRLAILYMIASCRAGKWMIPAFHAVLDEGYAKAHDDPQSFSLAVWADHLENILTELDELNTSNQSKQNP